MKLFTDSQTSTLPLLKFGNGSVTSSRNLLLMVVLIHSGIKVNPGGGVGVGVDGWHSGAMASSGLSKMRRRSIYPLHHCCLLCHGLARNTTIKIETRVVISRHPAIAISILNHFCITISKRSTSTSTLFKNSDNCWYSHWKCVTSLTDEMGNFCGMLSVNLNVILVWS